MNIPAHESIPAQGEKGQISAEVLTSTGISTRTNTLPRGNRLPGLFGRDGRRLKWADRKRRWLCAEILPDEEKPVASSRWATGTVKRNQSKPII